MPKAPKRTVPSDIERLFTEGTVGGLSDGELLDRFQRDRDELAFRALVERHGPLVWSVCRSMLRASPDAEDAFQATFLVLALRARSVRGDRPLGPWLFGVARRVAHRARHRAARRKAREVALGGLDVPARVSTERDLEPSRSELERAILGLPDRWRLPVLFATLKGSPTRRPLSGWVIRPRRCEGAWPVRGRDCASNCSGGGPRRVWERSPCAGPRRTRMRRSRLVCWRRPPLWRRVQRPYPRPRP